ncbi:hypothetical protein F0562_006502 [Nyssa sinensis]|uniref:CASP-like protein n=1 Tax=Nyssa sinensis TaxID=561372 RepID=A0A5J5ARW1_9ASTE|nr:hypothetical protein F0562_006502 [Nyssa sinensis]
MCLDVEFYSFTAFCFVVTIMSLVIPWSLTLALVDAYCVFVKCPSRQRGIMSIIVMGDWVLSCQSLVAACSTASVTDFLIVSGGSFCGAKLCSSSCESTSEATAKLILQDGRLQEFSYPVKASFVLQMNPTCFICNSDEMDFDDVVSAIGDDEELQPGQLYFALPLSQLRHPLQAEEMAALAVKASSALMKSGGEKCGCRRKALYPVMFSGEKGTRPSPKVADGGGLGEGGFRRGRSSDGGRRRNFTAHFSPIPE